MKWTNQMADNRWQMAEADDRRLFCHLPSAICHLFFSLALVLTLAAAAEAQAKPGDFTVDPLPAQQAAFPKSRAVGPRASGAGIRQCSTDICNTTAPHSCIEVSFAETGWRTCISNQGRRSLTLGPTDLRRGPSGPWMRVLREASVADIFVPYHTFTFRLYDMMQGSAASLMPTNAADTGPNGSQITLSGQSVPQVIGEVNDRGMAWLCKGTFQQQSRRGQELALWGVFDAQNYDFIIDYRLRDDGSLAFRLGATGFNNPYFPPESTTDAHMHSTLWRVDVDLNGSGGDSATVISHREGPGQPPINSLLAQDLEDPFNGGFEGTMVWEPTRFLTIGIEDETTNAHGNHIGYELHANPEGLSRHYGEEAGLTQRKEKFTKFDFAVTRYKEAERDAFFDTPRVRYMDPDEYLLGVAPFAGFGVSDGESVTDGDLVLWYRASVHHDPHDEDHAPGDPNNLMTGITMVHWSGFELLPRNLFDFNPLGAPSRNNCQ
jgi:Cu2+-containing amine oxidase